MKKNMKIKVEKRRRRRSKKEILKAILYIAIDVITYKEIHF